MFVIRWLSDPVEETCANFVSPTSLLNTYHVMTLPFAHSATCHGYASELAFLLLLLMMMMMMMMMMMSTNSLSEYISTSTRDVSTRLHLRGKRVKSVDFTWSFPKARRLSWLNSIGS